MKRELYFGVNQSSNETRINPGWEEFAPEKAGEYLGMIKLDGKIYVVVRSESKTNKGDILVDEVLFDSYSDGGLQFYSNEYKDSNCRRLEQKLNSQEVKDQINEGIDFQSLLDKISGYSSLSVQKMFNSRFIKAKRFEKSDEERDDQEIEYEERKGRKIEYEEQGVTQLPRDAFESLRDSKNFDRSFSPYLEQQHIFILVVILFLLQVLLKLDR